MGFMDKFGTGKGWLAQNLGKQARIDRMAARRDANQGTAMANRMQNRINRLSGAGGRIGDDNYRNPFKGDANTAYSQGDMSLNSGLGDTSQFDPSNKFDVMEMQKKLFPDDSSQWDGIFVKNTEAAYRGAGNENRQNQGLMGYVYNNGSQPPSGNNTGNQTTNTPTPTTTDPTQTVTSPNQHVMNSGNVIQGSGSGFDWKNALGNVGNWLTNQYNNWGN